MEFDDPVLSNGLVRGVVVDVFLLRVVDPGDSVSVGHVLPDVGVDVGRGAGSRVVLLSLVETYSLCVHCWVQLVSVRGHCLSLDSTILEFLSIRVGSGGNSPDIVTKFLGNGIQSLLGDGLADCGDDL